MSKQEICGSRRSLLLIWCLAANFLERLLSKAPVVSHDAGQCAGVRWVLSMKSGGGFVQGRLHSDSLGHMVFLAGLASKSGFMIYWTYKTQSLIPENEDRNVDLSSFCKHQTIIYVKTAKSLPGIGKCLINNCHYS